MDEKIKTLWQNNKLTFFLILPIIAIWFCRNVLISLLVSSGNKVVGDATEKSDQLKQEETVANTKADQIKADADKARQAMPVAGEDWNSK